MGNRRIIWDITCDYNDTLNVVNLPCNLDGSNRCDDMVGSWAEDDTGVVEGGLCSFIDSFEGWFS